MHPSASIEDNVSSLNKQIKKVKGRYRKGEKNEMERKGAKGWVSM
jgi:uncharacterized protein YgiM (DUF1202 family)